MEKQNKSNGFVWGVAIGIGLAALVGTKKGRAFIKELSEAGYEILQDFLEKKNIDLEQFIKEEEKIVNPMSEDEEDKEKTPSQQAKKRFFKGVKK